MISFNQNTVSFFQKTTRFFNQLSFSVLAIFIVMFLTWLFLLGIDKYDGNEIFKVFFYDSFANEARIKQILLLFGPFLLGAFAVLICLRIGVINLGISGQMSFAALGVYFSSYFLKKTSIFADSQQILWLPLLFLVGIFCSMLLSCLCGVLKVYFRVNEVLSTIFTNFIVFYVFRYLITMEKVVNSTKLATDVPVGDSIAFNLQFWLISVTFVVSLFLFIFGVILFKKTKFGFMIRVIGQNPKAARYGGINIAKKTITIFLISGFLAGISGIFYYYRNLDNSNLFKNEALPNNGFDTITIVWLSQSSLLGLPLAAFFVSLVRAQQNMIKISSINPIIVELIIGFLLLLIAFFGKMLNDVKVRRKFLHFFSNNVINLFQKLTKRSPFSLSLLSKPKPLLEKGINKNYLGPNQGTPLAKTPSAIKPKVKKRSKRKK